MKNLYILSATRVSGFVSTMALMSSSCLSSPSCTRAYGLPRLPALPFKAAQAIRSLPFRKQDSSTRLDSLSNGWPSQYISYRGESLSDIAETLQARLCEEGCDNSRTATPLGLGGLITSFSLTANFLMVNAAVAVTQEEVHILTQNIISWIIVSFIYFIVVPLILYYYLERRWYKRKMLEAILQFGLVFLFFPGMMLLAPFINMRRLPRGGAKEPWDDVRPY